MNQSKDILKNIIPQKSRFATNPSTIYITATPIGNLSDITIRAIQVLESVDFIICEDTRKTAILLQHYGIKSKLFIYNDHSDAVNRKKLLDQVAIGKSAAIVSDAGMPLIADPGYKLIGEAIHLGISISIIPGPSSTLSALALSGLPSDKFFFYGFMPEKSSARKKALEELQFLSYTSVFFESSKRLKDLLLDMKDLMPSRKISIARELTKLHEEVYRGDVTSAIEWINSHPCLKGEIVVVLDGKKEEHHKESEIESIILNMLNTSSMKETVEEISKTFSIPKKKVYNMCLKLRERV